MKFTMESLEGREVRLDIAIEPEELEKEMRAAAQRISRQVQIPGFRKGKAPYAVVLRMVGEESVREEALDSLAPRLLEEALEEAKIEPYGPATLEEVTQETPPTIRVRVPLEPVVELGDYRSLRVEMEEPTVSEEEIQEALKDIAERYATWEAKEGPVAEGDMVVVDLKGETEDGESVMESEGRSLIVRLDSVYPVPGFHEELVGLRAGESKEFTLPFPENSSNKELAGKPVRFHVTVREVQQRDVPAIDDDLARLAGDYEDLDALREEVRERLLQQRRQEAEEAYEQKVLEALREISRVEYPAVALEEELDSIMEWQEHRLQEQGLNMETYLGMLKTTEQAYREGLKPMAEERLVRRLLLAELATAEGLEPEAQAVDEVLQEALGGEEAAGSEETQRREVLKAVATEHLRREEALRWLVRHARGEAQAAGEEGAEEEPPAGEAGAEEAVPGPEAQESQTPPADE